MCAIVTIFSNSKLSPFSFMLGHKWWPRQTTVHGNIRYLLSLHQYIVELYRFKVGGIHSVVVACLHFAILTGT